MTQQIIDIFSSSDLSLSRTILINNNSPSSFARSLTNAVYRILKFGSSYNDVRNEEVSSMNEFRLRKAHWEGEGNACCCLNIPKQFWQRMEIDKESYLKVTYRQDEQKLIVEKLVDGGIIDNT
jgi:hypothetical protein